jgi:hypothetical protein
VKLGDRFGEDVEIIEGLHHGENVATTQLARLDMGTKVRVVAAAAASSGRATPSE